jgi:ABC-type bacteriocin/lantibiotic exporter with double-glycine peptidase domain
LIVILYSLKNASALAIHIVSLKNGIQGYGVSLEQVHSLGINAEKMKQTTGSIQFKTFTDQIVFKNVEFSYSGSEPVLQQINLVIPKGKMTAFVGNSGAGKTTLIDILMGFYSPSSGEVLIDNQAFSELELPTKAVIFPFGITKLICCRTGSLPEYENSTFLKTIWSVNVLN